MPGIQIARGTDPFKKYWWVILLAFGAVGAWICLPGLEAAGGGSGAGSSQEAGLKTADQSLDSQDNPSGAAGSAIDGLAMPGSKKKDDSEGAMSSLYQAPGGEVAASTAIVSAGTTFADALKDITRASAAKATVAAAAKGGWNEAPQRGFTAPKANFGAMSGFGGGSGSGASVSAGGGPAGSGSFGDHGPNTGVSFAKGLKDDGGKEPGAPNAVMRSLEKARAASIAAASAGGNDVAKGASGSAFDGNARTTRIGGGGGGAAIAGTGGVYGSLDSAPVNLKANDPNLNSTKIEPPPKPTPKPPEQDMAKQMMMQLVMSVAMAGVMAIL